MPHAVEYERAKLDRLTSTRSWTLFIQQKYFEQSEYFEQREKKLTIPL